MFTEEDLKRLKRIKIDYQRKQSGSNCSSALGQKSEDEVYINRYFLNESFKILHMDIIGTEVVGSSSSRNQSYMVYIIKVLTQEFSYEVRRRYSQFLKLYENVLNLQNLRNREQGIQQINRKKFNELSKQGYTFPIKKLSSSLLHFFNIANKQKLADQRKSDLCGFLNQIKNNYYKHHDQFADDYIELLKFIDMKQQHQRYWRRKEGRLIQLSSIALKDSNQQNLIKESQKKGEIYVNVEYLSELLQHQINKINLAIIARQSMIKSTSSFIQRQSSDDSLLKDPLVTDQIIKNVDCIKQIVLQLKRKISYEHVRCILKGKDLRQESNSSYSNSKKGLVEYSLKYTTNELVSMHILKILINVFMNSECNYSSEIFIKLLSEVELGVFALNQQKEQLCLSNKEFREIYFKLLKIYFLSKQQYGNNKKFNSDNLPVNKLMSMMLSSMFMSWMGYYQKNKQFKLRDEQKQWTIIIENHPKLYKNLKIIEQTLEKQDKVEQLQNVQKNNKKADQNVKSKAVNQKNNFSLSRQTQNMTVKLNTIQEEEYSQYKITAVLKKIDYKKCVQFAKNQKDWNKFLLRTESDMYSHTRKDFIKVPGKQEKMFRFIQREQIQMDLHEDDDEENHHVSNNNQELVNYENFTHLNNQEPFDPQEISKDPKTSIQTMPSTSGSCASEIKPEQNDHQCQDLALSRLSQEFILDKSQPKQGVANSYRQKVKIKRMSTEGSQLQILMRFSQSSIMKYFSSQITGATQYLWESICQGLENCVKNQNKIEELR